MPALLGLSGGLINKLVILQFNLLELVGYLHEDALVLALNQRILLFLLYELLLSSLDLSPQSAILFVNFTIDLLVALLHLPSFQL